MNPAIVFSTAQKYRDNNPQDQEAVEANRLYQELRSSSEPIPSLIEMFDQFQDLNAQTMILDILNHRIRFYWYTINQEVRNQIFGFFFNGINFDSYSNEQDPNNKQFLEIIKLISQSQAELSVYFYSEEFNLWDAVENFKGKHYFYFIAYFFTNIANPNLENIQHYINIRNSMTPGEIDNKIFGKILDATSNEELKNYGFFALSRYNLWGANYPFVCGNQQFLEFLLNSKHMSTIIELFTNTILRLNLESEGFISNIQLTEIFNHTKTLIQNLNQNANQNQGAIWKYIRNTATLINTIILSLDHNPSFLAESGAIPCLQEFASSPIQDVETSSILIPSLTYYIQNAPDDMGFINSILERISFYYKPKNDPFVESNQLIPNLCNAISKSNPNALGENLKNLCDHPNFANDPNFASAMLSALSYIKEIPNNFKFEVLSKLQPYYANITPNDYPTFFRAYYLIFFIAKLHIPLPNTNQQLDQETQAVLQTILTIMRDNILNQLPVITDKDIFAYQFLKPVRKIISKLRTFNFNFPADFIGFLCSEFVKLDQCPEEAAKIIGLLIDNNTIEVLFQILTSLNETIQQSKNPLIAEFALTIISNLKHVQLDQQSTDFLSQTLDLLHHFVAEYKIDKLIGLLYKAYAIIIPHFNIINLFPQLIELISGKFSLGCSFYLVNAILNSEQVAEFGMLQDYFKNSAGFLSFVLNSPPIEEEKPIFKEISKNYGQFLISYININRGQNLEGAANVFAGTIPEQLSIGYKHSCFIEHTLYALCHLSEAGCPAPFMANFVQYSMSFVFNPGFNPAYVDHQKVMEAAIRFHTMLIKQSFNDFKAKFEEFLAKLGASQRTKAYLNEYYQLCGEADPSKLNELVRNNTFYLFYNSVLSDKNSCSWVPQQSQPQSQE